MSDTKVSALSAATAAASANEIPINEAGTSKKLTVSLLRDFMFTNLGQYAPGSFTLATGLFAAMVGRLALTGSQRFTGQGTARLRID
jgi:hypothetical protein